MAVLMALLVLLGTALSSHGGVNVRHVHAMDGGGMPVGSTTPSGGSPVQ